MSPGLNRDDFMYEVSVIQFTFTICIRKYMVGNKRSIKFKFVTYVTLLTKWKVSLS